MAATVSANASKLIRPTPTILAAAHPNIGHRSARGIGGTPMICCGYPEQIRRYHPTVAMV